MKPTTSTWISLTKITIFWNDPFCSIGTSINVELIHSKIRGTTKKNSWMCPLQKSKWMPDTNHWKRQKCLGYGPRCQDSSGKRWLFSSGFPILKMSCHPGGHDCILGRGPQSIYAKQPVKLLSPLFDSLEADRAALEREKLRQAPWKRRDLGGELGVFQVVKIVGYYSWKKKT